jgi:surface polysaccharide O-acyltransferase-like enzyme
LEKSGDNRFIYAAKFIACLFVITIHARIPGVFGDFIFSTARFAVPFFFAVSGRFLLYNRGEGAITSVPEIRARVSHALKKLLSVTVVVYLIHLVFSFCFHMLKGYTVAEYLSSKYNLFETRTFFLFNSGRYIYDGSYVFDHMWYLFALIYVYLLIYIFAPVLRKWAKGLAVILLIFLFFGELLQTYYPVKVFGIGISTWYVMRNWLFVGIPFVMIGILFNDYAYAKSNMSRMKLPAVLMIVFGVILSYLEYYVLIDPKDVYFGSVLMVIGLLFLSECTSYKGRILYTLGKRASSNIYFYHVLIIAVIDIASQKGIIPVPAMGIKTVLVMVICFMLFCIYPLIMDGKRNCE